MNSSRTLSLALTVALVAAPMSATAGVKDTLRNNKKKAIAAAVLVTGVVAAVGAQYAGYDVKGALKLDKVSLPEMPSMPEVKMPEFAKTGYNKAAEKVGALLAWAKSFVWSASEAA